MILTQEQIKEIAEKLSKIPYNKEKNKNIWEQLNWILEYFNLLNEIDTTNVEAAYSVINNSSNLREDKIEENKIENKDLLACSNMDIIQDHIAISNIMK